MKKILLILVLTIFWMGCKAQTISRYNRGAVVYGNGSPDATDPALYESAPNGSALIYWNNALGKFRSWNGTVWTDLVPTGGAEINDLTASVTWANVPDANITQSSVTQHQGALSITESQISDLGSYLATTGGTMTGELNIDVSTSIVFDALGGITKLNDGGSYFSIDFVSSSGLKVKDNGTTVMSILDTGEIFTDGYIEADGYISSGGNDNITGVFNAYGNSTSTGGELKLYNSANEDTVQDFYSLQADNDFKILGGASVAFQVDDSTLGLLAPNTSISDINTLGNSALITKEYTDANYVTTNTTQSITGDKTFDGAFILSEGSFDASIITSGLTANRAILMPDASGTLALDVGLVKTTGDQTVGGVKRFTDNFKLEPNKKISFDGITGTVGIVYDQANTYALGTNALIYQSGNNNHHFINNSSAYNNVIADDFIAQSNLTITDGTFSKLLALGTAENGVYSLPSGASGTIALTSEIPAATSYADTGTVLDADNPLGTYSNMLSANATATYTIGNTALGGFEKVLINRATEPTITGATKETGSDFEANTDMYLYFYYDGASKYFFSTITGTVGGDNLGNHTATQNININGNALYDNSYFVIDLDTDNNEANGLFQITQNNQASSLLSVSELGYVDFHDNELLNYKAEAIETTATTGTLSITLKNHFQFDFVDGVATGHPTIEFTGTHNAGGYAEILINRATAPTIVGATQLPNTASFIASTDMVLCAKAFGQTVKYWWVEF